MAGTRAIPLVVKKKVIDEAKRIAGSNDRAIEVKELRKPCVGIVITGNEVYHGRVNDAFAPIIKKKIMLPDMSYSSITKIQEEWKYKEPTLIEIPLKNLY